MRKSHEEEKKLKFCSQLKEHDYMTQAGNSNVFLSSVTDWIRNINVSAGIKHIKLNVEHRSDTW